MREWGFTAIYQRTTYSVPDDSDGTVANIVTPIPIRAIRSELFRPLNGSGTHPQTAIQEGDLILYVQPTEKADVLAEKLEINPSADTVDIAGVSWNIVTVKAHAPDPSDVILYELYIRK
jgi:hypothetical protein